MAIETIDPDTGEIRSYERYPETFIRTPFNYDRDAVSFATGVSDFGPTRTQQQFKDEADINTIVRRFGITGQLPANPRVPQYGDFTQVTDYQTALNAVRAAEESFQALPAEIRAEFENNPQRLLEALENPRNRERLTELGLLQKEAPAAVPRNAPPESNQSESPAPAPRHGRAKVTPEAGDQSST